MSKALLVNWNVGRDARGRFTQANTYAALGWAALVAKRFAGDKAAAGAYIAQLGRWAYSQQALASNASAAMRLRTETLFKHPGRPEAFMQAWRASFEFGLSDVPPLAF